MLISYIPGNAGGGGFRTGSDGGKNCHWSYHWNGSIWRTCQKEKEGSPAIQKTAPTTFGQKVVSSKRCKFFIVISLRNITFFFRSETCWCIVANIKPWWMKSLRNPRLAKWRLCRDITTSNWSLVMKVTDRGDTCFLCVCYCVFMFVFVCYCVFMFVFVCYCLCLFVIVCYCVWPRPACVPHSPSMWPRTGKHSTTLTYNKLLFLVF